MDQDREFLDLKAQVAAQAAEIARLRERLEGVTRSNTERDDDREGGEASGRTSRRGLLKLAGAAAAGAAGASLLSAAPAGATTGVMHFGADNDAGTDATFLESTNDGKTFEVHNPGLGDAINAFALGLNPTAAALNTLSLGYGVVAQGDTAPIRLVPAGTSGPPPTSIIPHSLGEIFLDANGVLFQCVGAGKPGTWMRIGYNPLPATRILDTRPATHVGPVAGPIGPGKTVSIAVAGAHGVPLQASAVVLNATVTEGTAASFLTIWPEGATRPPTSNLNWSPGQDVANLVTASPGTGGGISVFNNAGDVQLVLDLAGFYS